MLLSLSPGLLAAILPGKAKDTGMERIHDALCNQHRDLPGHKYYHICLQTLVFIHMVCTLPWACRAELIPEHSPGAMELQEKVPRSAGHPRESLLDLGLVLQTKL